MSLGGCESKQLTKYYLRSFHTPISEITFILHVLASKVVTLISQGNICVYVDEILKIHLGQWVFAVLLYQY